MHCGAIEVFPIVPQPQRNVVLLGAIPTRLATALRIPICIQVAGPHRATFLELCVGRLSFADVQELVGHLWPEGGKVYVGDSPVPLEAGDFFTPTVGLLVRVLPSHSRPLIVGTVDDVLQRPHQLSRTTVEELQEIQEDTNAVGFLRAGVPACALDVPHHAPLIAIKCRIGELCDLDRSSFTCHRPCVPIADLEIQGRCVSGLVGVLPAHLHLAKIAFVDARALGKPVSVVVLPPHPFTLTAILGILELDRPTDLTFEIHGARRLAGNEEGFIPRDDMVILLESSGFRDETALACCEGERLGHLNVFPVDPLSTDSGLHSPPCIEDHTTEAARAVASSPEHQGAPHVAVAPITAECASVPAFASNAAGADDAEAPNAFDARPNADVNCISDSTSVGTGHREMTGMWNLGFVDNAHPVCTRGDTSVTFAPDDPELPPDVVLNNTIPSAGALSVPATAPGERQAEIIEAVLAPETTTGPGPTADTDEQEEVAAASSSVSSDDAPMSLRTSGGSDGEWRMPVRVISYQRAHYYSHLWVASGETLDEIMTRAHVLLLPVGGIWELLVPDAQPNADCLTILSYPGWWPPDRLKPFLVSIGHRPTAPYFEVIRPGDELDDVVPRDGAEGQWDTFLASGAPDREVGTLPDSADMLFVQAHDLPIPTFCVATTVAADSSLDTPSRHIPAAPAPDPMTYVLLGPGHRCRTYVAAGLAHHWHT